MPVKTRDDVREDLRKIAEANPHKTAACEYLMFDPSGADGRVPCCIVGVYLHNQGYTVGELESLGNTRIDMISGTWDLPRVLVEDLKMRFDFSALQFMGQVQEFQDENMTWGGAFDAAEELLNNSDD